MANYQSIPQNFNQIQSPIDTELIGKVLGAKQQQFDTNMAKVDETLAQIKMQENILVRPEDRERLANNVNSLLAEVNNSGRANLSSGSLTRKIQNYVNTALDDYTIDQIGNSQKIRNFEAGVQEIKQKTPKLYNNANYAYAVHKGGVQAYMNKQTDDVGNLNYSPYTDLTEEHLKKLKTIKDLKGERVVEMPDGKGGKVVRKIDGLSQQEIQEYFGGILTSEELQQMTINGWARYGQDEQQARNYYTDYNTKLIASQQADLKTAEINANNSLATPQQKQIAEQQAKSLRTSIENLTKNIENVNDLPIDSITLSLEKDTYLAGLSNIASTEWSTSYEKDDTWFAQRNLEIAYEDLAIKKNKAQRDEMEFGYKMSKEYGIGADGQPITEGQISVSTSDTVLEDEASGMTNLQKNHDYHFNEIEKTARELMTNLGSEEKKVFIANLNKYGISENLEKMPNAKANTSVSIAIKKAFDESNLQSYREYYDRINDNLLKKNKIARDIITVEGDEFSKVYNQDSKKYTDAFERNYKSLNISLGIKGNSIPGTHATEKLLVGDDEQVKNLTELKKEMESFVSSNGGWGSYAQNIKKDKNKIREFADLTDRIAKISKPEVGQWLSAKGWIVPVDSKVGIWHIDQNLKEDSQKAVEEILIRKSKDNSLSTFTVYDDINFLNENTRKRIIDRIPQGKITGNNFNPKEAFTVRRQGEGIVITQFQGETGTGKNLRNKSAEVVLDPGDASFAEIMRYVDLEEGKRLGGFSAREYTSFERTSPNLNTTGVSDDRSTIRTFTAVEEVAKLNPNIKQAFILGGTPLRWSTPEFTKEGFQGLFKNKIPQEILTPFIDTYINTINQFSLQVKPTPDPRSTNPGDLVYSIDVYNPNNKIIGNKILGMSVMDTNTKYLLDAQPQTFISEFIAQGINKDTNFINQVFKN